MTELQDALDKWDHKVLIDDWTPILEAARRVANAPKTVRNAIQAEIATQDDLPEMTAADSIDALTEVVLEALGITEDTDAD